MLDRFQPDDRTGRTRPSIAPQAILSGDRGALARSITLAESTRSEHREQAEALLAQLLPNTGRSVRIAVTGSPGVGKSTFIESFGLALIQRDHRVAVLTIDPSSVRSGGSILGDKTRMMDLARAPSAFIRPAPAGGVLGGVARRTRDAILLCEAAGYDVILVETVGVGQSETEVAEMTDLFMLLVGPGAGDSLQGIKRGVMEMAELVVVTKADGALHESARLAGGEYRSALRLMAPRDPGWRPVCVLCSALQHTGFADIYQAITDHRIALGEVAIYPPARPRGVLAKRRVDQSRSWMWREVEIELLASLHRHPELGKLVDRIEGELKSGQETSYRAARRLLAAYERFR